MNSVHGVQLSPVRNVEVLGGPHFREKGAVWRFALAATWPNRPGGVNTKNWGENWLAVRQSVVAQMHEVSQFMKLFKQRVGIWFNKSKGTYGTRWTDRFKSQLVQDGGHALRSVAA